MLTSHHAIRAMRLLVVDPEEASRFRTIEKLTKDGFEHITGALDATAALEALGAGLAAHQAIDMVFLALGPDRPDLRSFEEIHGIFNATLLLLVAAPEEVQAREALQHGADGYLPLPLNLELLLLKTEKLLTQRFLRRELRRTTARNEMLFLNVLSIMAKVLEAKDPYARYHSENVSTLAAAIARELGLQDDEVRRIGIAGILHDLGKLAIKESILKKPGPLDAQELEAVRRHPLIASTILEPIEQLQGALGYIRHHHEHYDGTGYPVGLAGEAIPLGARILHAAEAFATMTSRRSYSPARTYEEALAEMHRHSGTQFDPRVVEACALVMQPRRRPLLTPEPEFERPLPEVLAELTSRVAVDQAPRRSVASPPRRPSTASA